MMFDICPNCNGTGERDFLSGARCYYCDGTGTIEDTLEDYDEFDEDDEPEYADPEE